MTGLDAVRSVGRPRAGHGTAPVPRLIEDPRLAGALTLAAVGAVLWPIKQNWRAEPRDSFPLSYYPMFSARRPKRVSVTYLVSVDAQGRRRRVSYLYAGRGGLNQVRRQINRMVRSGQAERLCEAVAAELARSPDARSPNVVTVQVVRGRYRLASYFAGDPAPLSEHVLASHPIERAAR